MPEYILITGLMVLAVIASVKLIPLAFGHAFNKIITFHSLHMDDLAAIVSSLLF